MAYAPTNQKELEKTSKQLQKTMYNAKHSQRVWRNMEPFEDVRFWTDADNVVLKEMNRIIKKESNNLVALKLLGCNLIVNGPEEEPNPFYRFEYKNHETFLYGYIPEDSEHSDSSDEEFNLSGFSRKPKRLVRKSQISGGNKEHKWGLKDKKIPKAKVNNEPVIIRRTSTIAMDIIKHISNALPENMSIDFTYNAPESKYQSPDIYLFTLNTTSPSPNSESLNIYKYDIMAMYQTSSTTLPHLNDNNFVKTLTNPSNDNEKFGVQMVRQLVNYMTMHDICFGIIANTQYVRLIAKTISNHSDSDGKAGGAIWVSRSMPRDSVFSNSSVQVCSIMGYITMFISIIIRGDDMSPAWPGKYVPIYSDSDCKQIEEKYFKLHNDVSYAKQFFSDPMLESMEANGNNYQIEGLLNLDLVNAISKNKKAWSSLDSDIDIVESFKFGQHVYDLVYVNDWDKEPSFYAPAEDEGAERAVTVLQEEEISEYLKATEMYSTVNNHANWKISKTDNVLALSDDNIYCHVSLTATQNTSVSSDSSDASISLSEVEDIENGNSSLDTFDNYKDFDYEFINTTTEEEDEEMAKRLGLVKLEKAGEKEEGFVYTTPSRSLGPSASEVISRVVEHKQTHSFKFTRSDLCDNGNNTQEDEIASSISCFDMVPEVILNTEVKNYKKIGMELLLTLCRSRRSEWFGATRGQKVCRNKSYMPGYLNIFNGSSNIKSYEVIIRNSEYGYMPESSNRSKDPMYHEILIFKYLYEQKMDLSILPEIFVFGDTWQTNKMLVMKPWGRKMTADDIRNDQSGLLTRKMREIVEKLLDQKVALGRIRIENFAVNPSGHVRIVEMLDAFIFDEEYEEPVRHRELATIDMVIAEANDKVSVEDMVGVLIESEKQIAMIKAEIEARLLAEAEAAAAAAEEEVSGLSFPCHERHYEISGNESAVYPFDDDVSSLGLSWSTDPTTFNETTMGFSEGNGSMTGSTQSSGESSQPEYRQPGKLRRFLRRITIKRKSI